MFVKNCKMLMNEVKENNNKQTYHVKGLEDSLADNISSPQINLSIYCSSNKNPSWIF